MLLWGSTVCESWLTSLHVALIPVSSLRFHRVVLFVTNVVHHVAKNLLDHCCRGVDQLIGLSEGPSRDSV